jgi:hypothetical protein
LLYIDLQTATLSDTAVTVRLKHLNINKTKLWNREYFVHNLFFPGQINFVSNSYH